ncbi:hypothetical protein STCU_11809 [Strigomonas culicis]|uniref:Uncharacterized protein n=1 Tax=Strigomonas culicis TaxID=28005 RepID=S9UM03_9TRYP|nr:hypothetical protein STCU_11809 [Strigomonas culicis]|eukprot:EPY15721.1 hypothetical protein STCU_11809 [Strigomonas culicis]
MDVGHRSNYYHDVYKGDAERIVYYTATPDKIEANFTLLADNRVGAFVAGVDSTSFFSVDNIVHLTVDAYKTAVPIDKAAFLGENGFVYQTWLLTSGQIGCIAQAASNRATGSKSILSFVFDPSSMAVIDTKVIVDGSCLALNKNTAPLHHVRPSGLFFEKEKCFLYFSAHAEDGSVQVIKTLISDPFAEHGRIAVPLEF